MGREKRLQVGRAAKEGEALVNNGDVTGAALKLHQSFFIGSYVLADVEYQHTSTAERTKRSENERRDA